MPTEQISRTTEEDGWTEPFLMESPAPGETLALLWNAALGGDSAVAEAFTQCSFGRPRQCVPAGDTACISVGGKERFEARLVSRDAGEDSPEPAPVDTVTDDGAVFLLPPSNTEVAIQVIDACSQEGLNAFVVSFEPAADLDLTLYVTDTETGVINRYDEATTSAGTILDAPDFDTCP